MDLGVTTPATAQCVKEAVAYYKTVPTALLYAMLYVEGGQTGKTSVKRYNGSVDIGKAQINSNNLKGLSKYGITAYDLKNNECLNIKVGAYFLASNYHMLGNWTSAIISYNIGIGRFKDKHKHVKAYNQGVVYAKKVIFNWHVYDYYLNKRVTPELQQLISSKKLQIKNGVLIASK